uniref:Putative secreted protein n=1 Tax=Xenopsylla cheopis TaxID=163159 RepID=A0A6M2DXG6_XENCH
MLVFSGFFMRLTEVPSHLMFLCYLSYFRYAFGGAMFAVYGNGRPQLECTEPFCMYKSPNKFLHDMGLNDESFW